MNDSVDSLSHNNHVRRYLLWTPAVLLILMTAIHTIFVTPAHASSTADAAPARVPSYVNPDDSSIPLILGFIALAAVVSFLSQRSADKPHLPLHDAGRDQPSQDDR